MHVLGKHIWHNELCELLLGIMLGKQGGKSTKILLQLQRPYEKQGGESIEALL